MDGRLDMNEHLISGLKDPNNPDDAVSKGYISSRLQVVTDILNDIRERINNLEKTKSKDKKENQR